MSFRNIASQFKRTHAFRKTSVVYVPSQGWYHDACLPDELVYEAQGRTLDDVIDAVNWDGEFPTCDHCNGAFFEDLGNDSEYHSVDDLRLISRHKTAATRKIAWESSYRTDTGDEIIAYVSSLYDSGKLAMGGWSSREQRDAITKVVADNFPKSLLNKVTDADMGHLEDENCGAAMRAIAYLRPEFSNWVESDNMSTYASRKTASETSTCVNCGEKIHWEEATRYSVIPGDENTYAGNPAGWYNEEGFTGCQATFGWDDNYGTSVGLHKPATDARRKTARLEDSIIQKFEELGLALRDRQNNPRLVSSAQFGAMSKVMQDLYDVRLSYEAIYE